MDDDAAVDDAGVEQVAVPPTRTKSTLGRLARGLRWVFWRHLCFGGLAGALVLFCLSLTPSLLPRGWVLQGVVSGVTAVIGYGVGSMLSSGIRKVIPSRAGVACQADRMVGAARRDGRADPPVPFPRRAVAGDDTSADGYGAAGVLRVGRPARGHAGDHLTVVDHLACRARRHPRPDPVARSLGATHGGVHRGRRDRNVRGRRLRAGLPVRGHRERSQLRLLALRQGNQSRHHETDVVAAFRRSWFAPAVGHARCQGSRLRGRRLGRDQVRPRAVHGRAGQGADPRVRGFGIG